MNDEKKVKNNYIVGIGASAGGLEALQKLFSSLPSNTGFPYIIIQHLSPDYKSLLGEILSKYTEMPVVQAEEGMTVEPNNIYIIQPGKNMSIHNNRLTLVDQVPKELNLPIDIFFRSLAEEAGNFAISIILSGTGSDGTNGIKAIKENGGLVLVQNIDSSKFDGMPSSAIRTGLVDAQLSPVEIALELQHISGLPINQTYEKTIQEIDNELMKKIYYILKKISNINFTHYKQTTFLRRIERRMMITHKDQLADYVDYLQETPEEVKILSKEVLIGVTNFFRDPKFFQILKDKVVEEILNESVADETIRVWVAGCSTGEEAYSIAIIFYEAMESLKIKRNIKIFATDLDTEAITTAGKGVYGDNIVDSISTSRLSKFFTKKGNTYIVNRDIRKMIVFSPHNVFQDPPFGRLDLISCRNMLIYFQPVLQNDLFAIFHQALKDKGYLFLGKSEAIGAYTAAFPVIDVTAKIFIHNANAKIPNSKKVPYLQTSLIDEEFLNDNEQTNVYNNTRNERDFNKGITIDNSILEQFLPACVVVNEKNDLVYTYGDTTNFIHLSKGRYSCNIFDLITEALKIPVSTLLKESRDKKKKTQYRDIHFEGEKNKSVINLTVTPVSKQNHEIENLYAIVFIETNIISSNEIASEDSVIYDIDSVSSKRITDLEQELLEKQTKLDQSVQEQETVNEELQAANEELLTANEELQSSNEELQSVNEELYTVNSEYQQKLTELSDLNDDIANFLSSTLTGIIFVDNKLNIRRYTDYVTSEFSVMDHDIGRSLAFISYHFPTVDITEICSNVLKTLVADEREIVTINKKVFFMRVAPYRSTEDKILGCVITLMDITTQKQSQAALLTTEKKLSVVQQNSDAKSNYLQYVLSEIRKPIDKIIENAKSIKDVYKEDKVNNLLETTKRLEEIVKELSSSSSYEKNSNDKVLVPFALRSLLTDIHETIQNHLEEKNITLDFQLNDDFVPKYIGDVINIRQMIISFINNTIARNERDSSINLKVFEQKENSKDPILVFIIQDNGKAIDKEYINSVHNISPTDGLDLGFIIAKSQIEQLNGSVDINCNNCNNSNNRNNRNNSNNRNDSNNSNNCYKNIITIKIKMQRFYEKVNTSGYEVSPENIDTLEGCNILVAEDNKLNRIILCATLKQEKMTCVEAADGEEALNFFLDNPNYTFDCILMDMRMPKLDGIRATSMIRNSLKEDARTIPIIGVSANGFADDIKQAMDSGVNEYTTKPIDRQILISVMKKLIKKRNK